MPLPIFNPMFYDVTPDSEGDIRVCYVSHVRVKDKNEIILYSNNKIHNPGFTLRLCCFLYVVK